MNKTNIENLPTVSPLLNDEIVLKDYTGGIGIEENIPPEEQPAPAPEPGKEESAPVDESSKKIEDYNIDAAKMEDHTKGFTFNQPPGGSEGVPGDESQTGYNEGGEPLGEGSETPTDSYKLPEASAKEFAEQIAKAVSIYVPQFCYTFVKIDPNNIQYHIEQGNLRPEFKSVFNECNRNSESDLKFSQEEMELFEYSLQKYLEYKNVSYANPETAFWGTVAALGTKQVIVVNKLIKANQKLVYDAIRSTNPDFNVKQEKDKKAEESEQDKEKED